MKKEKIELSQEDIAFYKKNGYLLLKNVFTEEEALYFKDACRKVCEKNDSYIEVGDLLIHEGLGKFVYDSRIVSILRQLFGRAPDYFGDSSFYYGKFPIRGDHNDVPNDPWGRHVKKEYPLILKKT